MCHRNCFGVVEVRDPHKIDRTRLKKLHFHRCFSSNEPQTLVYLEIVWYSAEETYNFNEPTNQAESRYPPVNPFMRHLEPLTGKKDIFLSSFHVLDSNVQFTWDLEMTKKLSLVAQFHMNSTSTQFTTWNEFPQHDDGPAKNALLSSVSQVVHLSRPASVCPRLLTTRVSVRLALPVFADDDDCHYCYEYWFSQPCPLCNINRV